MPNFLNADLGRGFTVSQTTIQGYTSIALLKADEANPIYGDLKQIRQAAGKASNLTRQLLLFSRNHPTKFLPSNLNSTIEDLLKMLHRMIGEDIKEGYFCSSNIGLYNSIDKMSYFKLCFKKIQSNNKNVTIPYL